MKNLTITLVLAFVLFYACTPTSKTKQDQTNGDDSTSQIELSEDQSSVTIPANAVAKQINEPLPQVNSKPTTYRISPSEENTVTTENGTTITVPKNAFVDQDGNPIKGDVQLAFKEFHTASDVILSGIPMHVTTEDGSLEAFETAGMFEIEGTDEQGNEVRIANNKTIRVDLATYKEEENYNFYSYDKQEGLWTEEYKNTPVASNTARAQVVEQLSFFPTPQKPIEIKKASSNDFVFELAIDRTNNPEFRHFDNVLWKLKDNTIEDAQLFEKTIRDPNLTCVDRDNSVFQLTGKVGSRKVQTRVQPVLFGSNWKKAQAAFNKKLKAFKESVANKEELEERSKKMAKFQRTLSVSSFGIYNCDRYLRMKGRRKISFAAVFMLPALQKMVKQAFLIIKKRGKNEAVPLYSGANGYFIYAPHENNTLITFDDEGNIFEFSNEQFKALTAQNPRADKEQTLNFNPTSFSVSSKRDIQAYLDNL